MAKNVFGKITLFVGHITVMRLNRGANMYSPFGEGGGVVRPVKTLGFV